MKPKPHSPRLSQGKRMDDAFYLDNAATTPILPEVLEETLPLLREEFGNPSSLHPLGARARAAVKRARETLALQLGVPAQGIIFTGSGTESDNLALRGAFASSRLKGERLLISAIEHPAVRETARALERQGVRVATLPVTRQGIVDLPALEGMLDAEVRLVSCMAVNNEIGTAQPLVEIGRLIRRAAPKAVFHVDAVQAFTKLPLPWREAGMDLISLSAHKVHGPKGVGALVRCRPVPLEPAITGGGQEGGLRSGTENPFAMLAFALAAARAAQAHRALREERAAYHARWIGFLGEFPRVRVFRSEAATPFIVHFTHVPVPGEVTLHHLEQEGLAVSTGSACHTSRPEPSEVLLAVGMSEREALSAVRLSFSIHNRLGDLERVFPAFQRALTRLEKL
jgi:cysteine desulfurase